MNLEDRVINTQLRRAAEASSDTPFLLFQPKVVTFGEFASRTNRVANSLAELGLEKFGKLAIFARNSLEFLEAWFGASKLGALYVPINTEYKGEVLRYQLENADVTHIVIDPEFIERLDAIIDELPKIKHVLLTQPAEVPERLARRVNVHTFTDLGQGADKDPGVEVSYDHPHAISFTSGTTGPSKGVLAVNAHVVTFALDWVHFLAFKPHETIYTPLPLFHAIAAWLGVVPAVLNQTTISISKRFSAATYWDDIRSANADIAHGIFSMIPILLKQPERPDDSKQPARAYYIGNQNPQFEERFNCRVVEVYGATETGIVTASEYDAARAPKSCGKPNTRSFDVAILNDRDEPVGPGEVGEIAVRPRRPFSMIREYYAKPTATIEAFRNLWFHTGDNGKMDAEGNYYFVDRKKDAIRRRGENISSFELESAVNKHPDVLECAAVPIASELGEDDVKIVVVTRKGATVSAIDMWKFCDDSMPRFWVPRFIEFRDQLPKTANHKIQKYLLTGRQGSERLFERDWKTNEIREV
jgi:crotonobetaine/carnitine-CoA ligase